MNNEWKEYKKYQNKTLSQVEIDYLENLKKLENKIKKINKKERK